MACLSCMFSAKSLLPQLVEQEPFECTAGSKGIDILCRSVEGPKASRQYCGPHGRQLLAELYKKFCGKAAICSKHMSITGSEICLERKKFPSICTRRYRSCIRSTVCFGTGSLCAIRLQNQRWDGKHSVTGFQPNTLWIYNVRLPRHFSKSANIRRDVMRTHITGAHMLLRGFQPK